MGFLRLGSGERERGGGGGEEEFPAKHLEQVITLMRDVYKE